MDDLFPEANRNRNKMADIRYRLLQGLITYEEARAEAQPIIDQINARGAEIARETGMGFKALSFSYLMR